MNLKKSRKALPVAVIGSVLIAAILILGTLWTGHKAKNDTIKAVRKSDLGSSGNEISAGNLIFKSLRRNGYIEKLRDVKTKIYDLMNSL